MPRVEGKNEQTSQQIGAAHEAAVRRLLEGWSIRYRWKPRFRTTFGTDIEVDCLIPASPDGPPIVLECKDFAVQAKNPEDSKRRKTQEALWLLLQVKKYCVETKSARLVLITGQNSFREDQEALLKSELGNDFHIVALSNTGLLKRLLVADGRSA